MFSVGVDHLRHLLRRKLPGAGPDDQRKTEQIEYRVFGIAIPEKVQVAGDAVDGERLALYIKALVDDGKL